MDPEVQELSTVLENLKKRARAAVERLGDDGVKWSPGIPETNSAAQLLTHMFGGESSSIHQYVGGTPVTRNRDEEFDRASLLNDEERAAALGELDHWEKEGRWTDESHVLACLIQSNASRFFLENGAMGDLTP